MKKYMALGIMSLLFVFMLVGCGKNYTYEETEFETVVIECEEGTYHQNASYLVMANTYLAQQNYGLWSTYVNLANATGKYDYKITISIDEDNYTVIREDQYEVGQYVTVIKVNTYLDSQLIKTEYK